jgi:hypothetical protein
VRFMHIMYHRNTIANLQGNIREMKDAVMHLIFAAVECVQSDMITVALL